MNNDERALLESIHNSMNLRLDDHKEYIKSELGEFKEHLERFYAALCKHTSMPHCQEASCKIGIHLEHHIAQGKGRLAKIWQVFVIIISAVIGGVLARIGLR